MVVACSGATLYVQVVVDKCLLERRREIVVQTKVVVVHGATFGCLSAVKRASFFGDKVIFSSVQIVFFQTGSDVVERFCVGRMEVVCKEVQEGGCIPVFVFVDAEQVFDPSCVDVYLEVQASGNSKRNRSKTELFQSCLCSVVLWIFAQQVKFHVIQGVVCYDVVQGAD